VGDDGVVVVVVVGIYQTRTRLRESDVVLRV
jgi:hypothetical protein